MRRLFLGITSLLREIIINLPDEYSKIRVWYYNRNGCDINRNVSLSPNVRIRGVVKIGTGSSVAQNGSINGMTAGIIIGRDVMIAPNVVIVAFDHGTADTNISMKAQVSVEASIEIEDDVWVGANVTIGKGVRIGRGSVVGANSFVNRNLPPFSVAAGVPATVVKSRR